MVDNDNTTDKAAIDTAQQNQVAAKSDTQGDDTESKPEITNTQSKIESLKEEFVEWFESGERETTEVLDWFKSKF